MPGGALNKLAASRVTLGEALQLAFRRPTCN